MATIYFDSFDAFFPPTPAPSCSTPPPPLAPPEPASTPALTPSRRRGVKKVACARCRSVKEKCAWGESNEECQRCLARGVRCSGPVPLSARSRRVECEPPPSALVKANALPYHTSTGRQRALGPSSSEASLNAVLRAKALRAELVELYNTMWPSQPLGLKPDMITDLVNGSRDDASKVFLAISTATGARSSTNSEILQRAGPPLQLVDHLSEANPGPGGLSEWGLRRHSACLSLAGKAIEQAIALLASRPTFRTLKVALLASGTCTIVFEDAAGKRAFNAMTVRVWRAVMANPRTTAEERTALVGPIGLILLMRELKNAIASGEGIELLPLEQAVIQAHNPFSFAPDCFGIPGCTDPNQIATLDEDAIKTQSHRFHLSLLSALAPLLSSSALANLTRRDADALRQFWAVNDWAIAQVNPKLAQIKRLGEDQVSVLHQWQGRWRPSNPRDHALCLVAELATDSHDVDSIVYDRLRAAHASGLLQSTELDVAALVDEARERCRLSLKDVANSMTRWSLLERKHAILSRIFHHYHNNVKDWVQLALQRFGDEDGPCTRETELSVEELERITWGLRIGSFSQGTLVAPLRELEEGLERVRQVEAAAASSTADFDLSQYVVGLDFGDEAAAA